MMKLFTMYVGIEFDSEHEHINAREYDNSLLAVKQMLASKFGGYSVGHVSGGYIHADKHLAEERALRIEVTATDEQIGQVQECARAFRDMFRQESVLLNCTTIESAFV